MSFVHRLLNNPAMRLYLLGHALLLLGAWAMEATQSMLPMALAASAALLLTVPLLRQLGVRFAAARRRSTNKR